MTKTSSKYFLASLKSNDINFNVNSIYVPEILARLFVGLRPARKRTLSAFACFHTLFIAIDWTGGEIRTLAGIPSRFGLAARTSSTGGIIPPDSVLYAPKQLRTRLFLTQSSMPSNIEIKARVSDHQGLVKKASLLSQSKGELIRQHDTFFNCSNGRLKLRDFMNGSGQLIFYERPDTDGPKLSRYSISPTQDPEALRRVLSDAVGIKGEVRKERMLFLIGQTRVHLDKVEGLGNYMELEVVMQDNQSPEQGEAVARDLMKELGVEEESLVTGAYMDLLLEGRS